MAPISFASDFSWEAEKKILRARQSLKWKTEPNEIRFMYKRVKEGTTLGLIQKQEFPPNHDRVLSLTFFCRLRQFSEKFPAIKRIAEWFEFGSLNLNLDSIYVGKLFF